MSIDSYYPAFLDLSGRRCVVFGGGQVALRKVEMLREFGGVVEVVSPELCPELEDLRASGPLEVKLRQFDPGDLDGAFMAIAATNDRNTNEDIAREARRRRVLVNVVDVPELCDFIVPSYLRRGRLTIAVSTSGSSPALAKKVRVMLENQFGEEYSILSSVVSEVREQLKQEGSRSSAEAWQSVLEIDSILALLRQGKREEVKAMLHDALVGERKDF